MRPATVDLAKAKRLPLPTSSGEGDSSLTGLFREVEADKER